MCAHLYTRTHRCTHTQCMRTHTDRHRHPPACRHTPTCTHLFHVHVLLLLVFFPQNVPHFCGVDGMYSGARPSLQMEVQPQQEPSATLCLPCQTACILGSCCSECVSDRARCWPSAPGAPGPRADTPPHRRCHSTDGRNQKIATVHILLVALGKSTTPEQAGS